MGYGWASCGPRARIPTHCLRIRTGRSPGRGVGGARKRPKRILMFSVGIHAGRCRGPPTPPRPGASGIDPDAAAWGSGRTLRHGVIARAPSERIRPHRRPGSWSPPGAQAQRNLIARSTGLRRAGARGPGEHDLLPERPRSRRPSARARPSTLVESSSLRAITDVRPRRGAHRPAEPSQSSSLLIRFRSTARTATCASSATANPSPANRSSWVSPCRYRK